MNADRNSSGYFEFTRERLHCQARALRTAASRVLPAELTIPDAVLMHDADRALLRLLDIPNSHHAYSKSLMVSDRAIEDLGSAKELSALHRAGLIGTILERENWEFPSSNHQMIENLAIAKRSGTFFTPISVAWYMAQCALSPTLRDVETCRDPAAIRAALSVKVLDPACGAGIFLAAAWQTLMDAYSAAVKRYPKLRRELGEADDFSRRIATTQLFGVELSPRYHAGARIAVSTISGVAVNDLRNIRIGDALAMPIATDMLETASKCTDGQSNTVTSWADFGIDGFDVILMNPPYGRLRVLRSEMFEKTRRLRVSSSATKRALVDRTQHLKSLSAKFRKSHEFAEICQGVLDWPKLFVCRSMNLLAERGRLCAIIPASFLADRSYAKLRRHMFENCKVSRIDRISESAKMFVGVNQPTCIVTAAKGDRTEAFISTVALKTLPPSAAQERKISFSEIRNLSPDLLPVPLLSEAGRKLLNRLSQASRIKDQVGLVNARGEFDLTAHRSFMAARGKSRLIRGDHIERFQLRNASNSSKEGYVRAQEFISSIPGSEKVQHINLPRIVGRQCSFMEKKRRLSFGFVSAGSIVSNSCNYLATGQDHDMLFFLCGLMNSSLTEWRFRLTNSNNHVANYELAELPFPDRFDSRVAKISKDLFKEYESKDFGLSAAPCSGLEDQLDCAVFELFGLDRNEVGEVVGQLEPHRLPRIIDCLTQ